MTSLEQAHYDHSVAKVNLDTAQMVYNQAAQKLSEEIRKSRSNSEKVLGGQNDDE